MTGCPRERFPTLTAALEELAERRARAALSGTHRPLEAYVCETCRGAHIRRRSTRTTFTRLIAA